jgi:charged multivesicular body protein 6
LVEKETEYARRMLKEGKKDRAKLALQKKKFQENLIAKTEAKLLNIEELVNSVEFAKVQAEVFNALKVGNDALQKINSTMSIDEVEKLMDDTAEAIAYQEEISQLLGTELTSEDNDAVLEELNAIEQGEAIELKGALPDAPKTKVNVVDEKPEEPVVVEQKKQVVMA